NAMILEIGHRTAVFRRNPSWHRGKMADSAGWRISHFVPPTAVLAKAACNRTPFTENVRKLKDDGVSRRLTSSAGWVDWNWAGTASHPSAGVPGRSYCGVAKFPPH